MDWLMEAIMKGQLSWVDFFLGMIFGASLVYFKRAKDAADEAEMKETPALEGAIVKVTDDSSVAQVSMIDPNVIDDATAALVKLGSKKTAAKKMVAEIAKPGMSVEDVIRATFKKNWAG